MIDLWALRILLAVGQGGSFSAAAVELGLTQPAVSRQIATLERRLGVCLFNRLPRGVRPTAAGEAALEQAGAVLGGMTLLEQRMQSIARAEAGKVRVSTFSSAATQFVPECLRTFATLHGDVDLSMIGRAGGNPTQRVLEGEIDLALFTSWDPDPVPGLEAIPLMDDPQFVALAKDHPAAVKSTVRLRDLVNDPWIEGSHPDCLGPISELTTALGRPPQVAHVCDDWNGKQGLVAAGLGVMLYPMVAGWSTLRPDIRLLRPSPRLTRKLRVAALPEPFRAPAVTAFIEAMQHASASLLDRGT